MSRLLVILTLLAAAVPAAAGAQTPTVEEPVATTDAADSITQTAANLNGTVDPNGTATTYHFEYGPSAGYGSTTPEDAVPEGTDPVRVKAGLQGLTSNTIYHYRLVATNPAGVSRGADRTFRTAPGPQAPAVRSTTYRDLTSRSATLATEVDPNRQSTSVRFEYGRTTSYGRLTPRTDAGSGDSYTRVSILFDGLRPNTRYHFRTVATNATGTTRSNDRSFVTRREPRGISITLAPSRVTWGGDLTVIGRVYGSGIGGIRVMLQRQAFPFQSGFTDVASVRATSKGTFHVNVNSLFETTHFLVVTQTRTPVYSAVHTASSLVKVGARGRSAGRKRVRIQGTIGPQLPQGRVLLQKRTPRGKWRAVNRQGAAPLDAAHSRYRFTVRREKHGRRASRYRVVVLPRDGGAHLAGRSRQVRVASMKRR